LTSLTVPASVTVTSGSTTAPFTVSTGAVGTDQNGTLTASYNGTSQSISLTLAATTVISSLYCSPTTLGANASSSCTVTLSKPAPDGGAAIGLGSSGLTKLTIPPTVTVTAGSIAAPFTVSTGVLNTDQSGSVTATYNGTSQAVVFTLTGTSVVSSLVCDPTTLGANARSACTVTLSTAPNADGTQIKLSTSGLPSLTLPNSVTVAAGSTVAVFTAGVGALTADENGTLTASYNGSSQNVTLSLAAAMVISSLQCAPGTLTANTNGACTVTMSKKASTGGAVVTLGSNGLPGLLAPASVTVAAGSTTATFTISSGALTTSQNGTLTATYNGSSKTLSINLSAGIEISSLACNKAILGPHDTAICTVTLSATGSGALVALSSNLPSLAVPRVAFVPVGSTSVDFKISTLDVKSNVTGKLTATYNRNSLSIPVSLVSQ
jgi:hypothetical protein